MTLATAPVAANAKAKAANAVGSDTACAIAPVASGAGKRVSALNNEAEARPTAGPAADWRAASAKPHGTMGPVPTPIKAKPATLSREAGLDADQREAGRCDRERGDDDAKVAGAKTNRVGVEAQRSLAGGKERRAEAGNRRQLRRFLTQQQRRPQRRRQFRRDRDADHDAYPDQSRREGQSASPPRPDRRRSGKVIPRRTMVGDAGKRERQRGKNAGRPRRRARGDQTAEDRADRHAGRRRSVQPGQDRAAEPALDPRAFGVHEQVDHAAEESGDDQGDRDPSFARRR